MTLGDLAYTCDSDALPFGCSLIVQYLGTPKETWIKLQDVLEELKMDLLTFRKFCVLLGSDFNPRLPKCGPAKVQQCIKTFSTFEKYCRDNAQRMTEDDKLKWIAAAEKSLQVFCSG
jgi:5'-3' exonuclease